MGCCFSSPGPDTPRSDSAMGAELMLLRALTASFQTFLRETCVRQGSAFVPVKTLVALFTDYLENGSKSFMQAFQAYGSTHSRVMHFECVLHLVCVYIYDLLENLAPDARISPGFHAIGASAGGASKFKHCCFDYEWFIDERVIVGLGVGRAWSKL